MIPQHNYTSQDVATGQTEALTNKHWEQITMCDAVVTPSRVHSLTVIYSSEYFLHLHYKNVQAKVIQTTVLGSGGAEIKLRFPYPSCKTPMTRKSNFLKF